METFTLHTVTQITPGGKSILRRDEHYNEMRSAQSVEPKNQYISDEESKNAVGLKTLRVASDQRSPIDTRRITQPHRINQKENEIATAENTQRVENQSSLDNIQSNLKSGLTTE